MIKTGYFVKIVVAGLLASSLFAVTSVEAKSGKAEKKALSSEVQAKAEEKLSERRKQIKQEAVTAIVETKRALLALEEKKSAEAQVALKRAIGELELVLAREPKLALATVDVMLMAHDLYSTPEQIKQITKKAVGYLKDGELQKARPLISELASGIVISVTSLPLITYPVAIMAAVPLIDAGKIDEAKLTLQAALNTIVVTDFVIPLPVLRAEELLVKAEMLAEKAGRSENENKDLAKLLTDARSQLKIA
jgi:hypothetical protein